MLTRIHFPGEFEMSIGGASWLFKTFRINYYSKHGFINGIAFPFISERMDHKVLWTSGVILADIEVLDGTDTEVYKGMVIGYITEVVDTIPPPPHSRFSEWRDQGSIPLMVTMSGNDYARCMKELSDKKQIEKTLKSVRSQLSRLRRSSKKKIQS